VSISHHILSRLFAAILLLSVSGCTLPKQFQEHRIGDVGHFEFREPNRGMEGVVIGAPRGHGEPASVNYAKWISDRTGAGVVIGYGFSAQRLAVTQPVVRYDLIPVKLDDPVGRGSVYPEFKKLLRQTAKTDIEFYVGVRMLSEEASTNQIEVAASGFTFEELNILKQAFQRIRDQVIASEATPKVGIAMEPLDKIFWNVTGVKHHGVLMMAEKGLNLRLPKALSIAAVQIAYRDILALWVAEAIAMARENPFRLPQIEVKLFDSGRIVSVPARGNQRGVVIAAPHGSADEYTAEMVKELSHRTGLPAVIAKGFTPTEAGGWRINVNRPTEKSFPGYFEGFEIDSDRAMEVYRTFKDVVLQSSQGKLDLYIDIHQNGQQNDIEVATLGLTREQAQIIKNAYLEIRDQALRNTAGIAVVDLVIEPLDVVQIGAWAAKGQGILGVAKTSLHFELPVNRVLVNSRARETYTTILARLLSRTAHLLLKQSDRTN
jgi:hypothetical protein